MASTVRDRLNTIPKSPVTTELMPALIGAGKLATVYGFSSSNASVYGDNAIAGEKLFDSVLDGNNTTSETMNRAKDGLNLRIYRIDEARIPAKAQGLYPIEEIVPICFCPTFGFMKDQEIGQESIDDHRENLRLATIAIFSEKNFPNKNNVYRRTQPQIMDRIPMSVQNYIMQFERKEIVNGGDNWYSAPFTIFYSVNVKNFI